MSDNNEINFYNICTNERELTKRNPNYKNVLDEIDLFGNGDEPEFVGTGEFVKEVDLDNVLHLKLIEVIEELGNKLLNGRLKNVETEKVRLSYYKLYLESIRTYLDFKKNHVGNNNVNVNELEPILKHLEK